MSRADEDWEAAAALLREARGVEWTTLVSARAMAADLLGRYPSIEELAAMLRDPKKAKVSS